MKLVNPKSSNRSTEAKYDHPSGVNNATPPDDFESFDEFQPIISLARSADKLDPPKNFIQGVMSRVSETDLSDGESADRNRLKTGFRNITVPASGTEIAFCYFLAGFFYLVVGSIAFIGLNSLQPHVSFSNWLNLQPQIALVSAGGLALLGYILTKNDGKTTRIAKIGTKVFLLTHLFNGIYIHTQTPNLAQLPVQIGFVVGSVGLGLFLVTVMSRYSRFIPGPSTVDIKRA
jgi:hypothetical protein